MMKLFYPIKQNWQIIVFFLVTEILLRFIFIQFCQINTMRYTHTRMRNQQQVSLWIDFILWSSYKQFKTISHHHHHNHYHCDHWQFIQIRKIKGFEDNQRIIKRKCQRSTRKRNKKTGQMEFNFIMFFLCDHKFTSCSFFYLFRSFENEFKKFWLEKLKFLLQWSVGH